MSHAVPLAAIAVPCGLYAAGAAHLWSRAGLGRGLRLGEALCAGSGFAVLAATLLSPLHHWSEALFSVHMAEHEMLMTVAAPLLILGNPLPAMLWAFPIRWRQALGMASASRLVALPWRSLQSPLVAAAVHGLAIWLWHVPVLFEAALASGPVHWLQHASFLLTALVFWSSLLRRFAAGPAIFCLFATASHTGLLGALLTVSRPLWYAPRGAEAWGLSALEDQQLAGLIMWMPPGFVYLGAALMLAFRWLAPSARRSTTG